MMPKRFLAIAAFFAVVTPSQAHQIWIEQEDGQNAVVRFGEFGENLREASPGLLDKFGKVVGTLVSRDERKADATKTASGFNLPFAAAPGETVVAEDAAYPLYTWKQPSKEVLNRFYPAARLISGFAPQDPKLVLDLVPTGQEGRFKLFFKNQPRAKTKVNLVTQSGWSKEGHTDEHGLVTFDVPWKGTYVAEVSVNDAVPGERMGANGVEKYDAVSYSTALTFFIDKGLPAIPAGPPATPAK